MKKKALNTLPAVLLAAVLGFGTIVASSTSQAAAPFQQKQVAGFYRTTVGAFEVTALLDGTSTFDVHWLRAQPTEIQPLAAKQFQENGKLAGTVAAFLINTGKQLILVDTGSGGFWGGPALGHLTENLRASGYRPEQVDLVLLTHLHADHVAGLRKPNGTRKFPNATVSMLQPDSEFWLSKEIASQAPAEAKEFFDIAQASAKPYLAAGRWKPIAPGAEVVPGNSFTAHRWTHAGPHRIRSQLEWAVADDRRRRCARWAGSVRAAGHRRRLRRRRCDGGQVARCLVRRGGSYGAADWWSPPAISVAGANPQGRFRVCVDASPVLSFALNNHSWRQPWRGEEFKALQALLRVGGCGLIQEPGGINAEEDMARLDFVNAEGNRWPLIECGPMPCLTA